MVVVCWLGYSHLGELGRVSKTTNHRSRLVITELNRPICVYTYVRVYITVGLRKQQIDASTLLNQLDEYTEAYEACFKNESTDLYIVWQPPKSLNALDLMSMINDIERRNNVKIDILFLDYADKMNAVNPSKADQEWRDLGAITDELKTLAVDYDIPVVTVTQLTTSSYKKDAQLDGSAVAGSRRKFENTDFLAIFDFISRDMRIIDSDSIALETVSTISSAEDWVEIWCTVDKNRDGPSNIKFKTFIDYSSYRMVDDMNAISSLFGVVIKSASVIKPEDIRVDVGQKSNMGHFL